MEQKHKRRPHYGGRYPRKYEEKYKELQPEKYQDEIRHVMEKGNTPAGMHIPIMVQEILNVLRIEPGQNGLDCTLGYGGHTQKMLQQLSGEGHLCSLDLDPIEIKKTTTRLRAAGFPEELWTPVHISFAKIDRVAETYGPFDFILADLGVSSMQIDNPERGFSYKADGPLDLRFDPEKGEAAAERLASLSKEEFEGMLVENSDEPYAKEIAGEVHRVYRSGKKIETTSQLRTIVEQALKKSPALRHASKKDLEAMQKKSCTRVFQALRIDVNSEFEALYAFLEKLPQALKSGGRAAILTFHSGEDRLVKKAFKNGLKNSDYAQISPDVIRPTKEECYRNPRAHSTKLRWAEAS